MKRHEVHITPSATKAGLCWAYCSTCNQRSKITSAKAAEAWQTAHLNKHDPNKGNR